MLVSCAVTKSKSIFFSFLIAVRLGGDLLSAQTVRVEQDLALCKRERHRVEITASTVPRFLKGFRRFTCLPARSNFNHV